MLLEMQGRSLKACAAARAGAAAALPALSGGIDDESAASEGERSGSGATDAAGSTNSTHTRSLDACLCRDALVLGPCLSICV
jgi:hypothetical protein